MKNKIKFLPSIILTSLMLLVFVLPFVSSAQCIGTSDKPCPKDEQPTGGTKDEKPIGGTTSGGTNGDGKIHNPLKSGATDITTFIHDILIGALKIGIPVIALAIIYCGFLFVAARGKPEAITKARDALLYTIIGAAILLGSWAIANLIVTTVGGLG